MTDTFTLPDKLEQVARVLVSKGGTVAQGRRQINFVEGTNMTITATDDATGEKVDVTFTSATNTEDVQDIVGALTGFGGSGLTFSYNDGAGTVTLDVNVGTGIEVSSDALRISAAAAGAGLTGGAGSALAVGDGYGTIVGADQVDVDLGMVDTTTAVDQTIPADYAAYVPAAKSYEIPSGFGLTLESGAALELGPPPQPRGWVWLDEVNLSADGPITFANIPQTYTHLQVFGNLRAGNATMRQALLMRINGDAGSNYDYVYIVDNNATAQGSNALAGTSANVGTIYGTSAAANVFGTIYLNFPNYTSSSMHKAGISNFGMIDVAAANTDAGQYAWKWRSTDPIKAITFLDGSAGTTFKAGSRLTLMGLL